MITIPSMSLVRQHASIRTELNQAIADVIDKSAFIRGPFVDNFEQEYAALAGATHCVSCANGTDAIYIALKSLQVKPGDEVIVPAMSWISTSATVSQCGARVVFCDIDPKTYTMCPASLKSKITKKTVGVIPVHLYGHPAPMKDIYSMCKEAGLWIIEDAAQAHLAELNGERVGTWGDFATFSFYPGKNLGALGDAGCLVTNNDDLALYATKFARHGGLKKGDHEIEGINSRLDGIQAAILSVKMQYINDWTAKRIHIANEYLSRINNSEELILPTVSEGAQHVWHLFVLKVNDRQEFRDFLAKYGIGTSINYPKALPQLPCYEYLSERERLAKNATDLACRGVAIPMFPEMTSDEIDAVVTAVNMFQKKY